MRVLVIGSGGREHTLAWRLSQSDSISEVMVGPGNGGTAAAGWNVDPSLDMSDPAVIAGLAPDLVVIGPEAPLVAGLGDSLRALGISVFGPGADGARLEGSKIFSKRFMDRYNLPTAAAVEVDDPVDLPAALDGIPGLPVLKADGLAAGKGVVLPGSREEALKEGSEMLSGGAFGEAGRKLLVEERLTGYEISLLAICDGKDYFLLPSSQDHKRVGEGDTGVNTGGMGAYSPVPGLGDEELDAIAEQVFGGTLRGLNEEGIDYRGVLYAGLMMTDNGPKLLEFNCRFGDPETQAVLPRLDGDFGRLLSGAAMGALDREAVRINPAPTMTVVLASGGYPGSYPTGFAITGLGSNSIDNDEVLVFHAGTKLEAGEMLTAGGRVLALTACGEDLAVAAERCYNRVAGINFRDCYYRRDIGWRVLQREGGRDA
ncbi:MAG: phosphoribosylamine--glycine ligase [bacterium]|nr:phosphoribosylamine--glycine ligase [bacterium]